jgi:hypothetical protein
VERVIEPFLRSPKKSVSHASGELYCVEGVAKETGNEALSSSLSAAFSIILVHGVLISLL